MSFAHRSCSLGTNTELVTIHQQFLSQIAVERSHMRKPFPCQPRKRGSDKFAEPIVGKDVEVGGRNHSQMKNTLRIATKCDIDRLYEIYSHESVSPYMGFDPCSQSEFAEIFDDFSSAGDLIVWEDERGVLAVCQRIRRRRRLRHSAYLGSLAVHHAAQKTGIGKRFFGAVVDQLKEEGVSRIELLVAADNDHAIGFFKRFGFAIEGTHPEYFSRAGSESLFSEHTMGYVKSGKSELG